MALNKFPTSDSNRLLCANVLSFIKLEPANKKYDIIICDPPTFSNSKKMKQCFNIDSDYPELLTSCIKCLSKNGTLIFSTNSRGFKLNEDSLSSSISISEIGPNNSADFKNKKSHRCWILSKK